MQGSPRPAFSFGGQVILTAEQAGTLIMGHRIEQFIQATLKGTWILVPGHLN